MNVNLAKLLTRSLPCAIGVCVVMTMIGNAQVRRIYDLRTPIAKRSKIKYIDLAKLVFPDAHTVKTTVAYPDRRRAIEYYTEASTSVPVANGFRSSEPRALKHEVRIDAVDSLVIWTEQGDRLLLLFSVTPFVYLKSAKMDENGDPIRDDTPPARDEEVEQSYINVLAVFRTDKKPELLDAIDVRESEDTIAVELFAPLLVKTDVDGFLINNRQKGLSDNFSSYSLYGFEGAHLKLLSDSLPDLMTSSKCDADFEDIATFWDAPMRGTEHRKIWMRLVRTENVHGKDCKRVIRKKVKTQLYSVSRNATDGKYYLKVEPPRKKRR